MLSPLYTSNRLVTNRLENDEPVPGVVLHYSLDLGISELMFHKQPQLEILGGLSR